MFSPGLRGGRIAPGLDGFMLLPGRGLVIFGLDGLILLPGFIAGRAGLAGGLILPGRGRGIGFTAEPGLAAGRGLIFGLAGRGIGFTVRFGRDAGLDTRGRGAGFIFGRACLATGLATALRGGGGFICPCLGGGGAAAAVSIKEKLIDVLRKKANVIMLMPRFIFFFNIIFTSFIKYFLYILCILFENATSFYPDKKTVRRKFMRICFQRTVFCYDFILQVPL